MSATSASQPAPMAAGSPSAPLSWEGDKMFNIYIHDYCSKRGFTNTARELLTEAEIEPDSKPPINARQGLLFEWWSVFWVLFTAKSSGTGTDDAMTYIQQQQSQQRDRIRAATNRAGPPASFNHPSPRALNGQMQNGVGTHGLVPMQNNVAPPFSLLANGVGGPSPGQNHQGSMNNAANMFGQRAALQHQRLPSNGPQQYPSPTMNQPSPNSGGVGGPPLTQPLMGQLAPSPHMAHMQRPGGMNDRQATNAAFQNFRPSSRTGSPGQHQHATQASPGMANRQIQSPRMVETQIAQEINRIGISNLNMFRADAGLVNRDINTLSIEEKTRLITVAHQRMGAAVRARNAPNATAGPSGLNQQGQQRPQQDQQQQQANRPLKRSTPSPPAAPSPRNESSPPDRKRLRPSPSAADQPPPMNAMYPPSLQQQPQAGGMTMRPHSMNGLHPGGPPPHMSNNPNLAHLGQSIGGQQGMGSPQMGQAGINTMHPGNPQAPPFNPQFRQSPAMQKNGMAGAISGAMQGPPGLSGAPTIQQQQQHHIQQQHQMHQQQLHQQQQQQQLQQQHNQNQQQTSAGDVKPAPPPSPPGKDVQKDPPRQTEPNPSTPSTQQVPPTPEPSGANADPDTSTNNAASPSAILNNSGSTMAPSQMQQLGLSGIPDFTNDLMPSGFGGYDPLLFNTTEVGDADGINFERDFGNWFSTNTDDLLMNAASGT